MTNTPPSTVGGTPGRRVPGRRLRPWVTRASILGAALMLAACSGDGSGAEEGAPSADARVFEAVAGEVSARLVVPPSALPEGTSVDEIRVSVETETEGDGALFALVTLEPSGLVFDEPVPLELTVPPEQAGLVMAWLLSDGAEPEALDVEFVPSGSGAELRMTVRHFSEVVVYTKRPIDPLQVTVLAPPPPSPIIVGQPFTVRLRIDRPTGAVEEAGLEIDDGAGGYYLPLTLQGLPLRASPDLDQPWNAGVVWTAFVGPPRGYSRFVEPSLTPGGFETVAAAESFVASQTFVCTGPGRFELLGNASAAQPMQVQLLSALNAQQVLDARGIILKALAGIRTAKLTHAVVRAEWERTCVAPEVTATATATSTAEPSATAEATGTASATPSATSTATATATPDLRAGAGGDLVELQVIEAAG